MFLNKMEIIIEHNIKFWSNLKLKYESRALMMNFLLTGLIERWRALVWIAPLKSNRFNLYSLCSKWSSKILKKNIIIYKLLFIYLIYILISCLWEKKADISPRAKSIQQSYFTLFDAVIFSTLLWKLGQGGSYKEWDMLGMLWEIFI